VGFGQAGIAVPDNFFSADINSEKPENVANHYPCAVKSELSMADFSVCYDVFADFDSHSANSNCAIYKDFEAGK